VCQALIKRCRAKIFFAVLVQVKLPCLPMAAGSSPFLYMSLRQSLHNLRWTHQELSASSYSS